MPIPRTIAKLNRASLNRISRRFAGRIPPFVLVSHTGRSSGKYYTVPLMAFRPAGNADDQFVIALTYGETTDWQKNIQAGGPASITSRDQTFAIETLRTTDRQEFRATMPWIVHCILDLIGADHVAVVNCSPASPDDNPT
jgi:deazaflavin-dependent oxidoreductase (nitroreductase family)